MGIMTFGAFKIYSFELRLGQPLSAPYPVSAVLPVFVDQAVVTHQHVRVLPHTPQSPDAHSNEHKIQHGTESPLGVLGPSAQEELTGQQ